jgi:hypothetical protein
MSLLTQVSIPSAFIIFFLTLGPLKAIGPFAKVTRGADPALLRALAWRATVIATVIVMAVALLGVIILKNWRVSMPAIMIAGGLIFFFQAVKMIMEPPAAPPLSPPQPKTSNRPPPWPWHTSPWPFPPWSRRPASRPSPHLWPSPALIGRNKESSSPSYCLSWR